MSVSGGAVCASCGAVLVAGDLFCENCGTPVVASAPTLPPVTCGSCGSRNDGDDSFCSECGAPLTVSSPATPAPVQVVEAVLDRQDVDGAAVFSLLGSVRTAASAALLLGGAGFCHACGADLVPPGPCAVCGVAAGALPAPTSSPVGTLHRYRKGIRKRYALRVATDATSSTMLMEDGTTTVMAEADVPAVVDDPLGGEGLAVIRTSAGRVARLATAVEDLPWSGSTIDDYALKQLDGTIQGARGFAMDALAIGRLDLFERSGISPAEQAWLQFISAAQDRDIPALFLALGQLPPRGYRPKLGVLAALVGHLRTFAEAREVIGPHLEAYADEPSSGLLRRALGSSTGTTAQRVDDARFLSGALPIPVGVQRQMDAVLDPEAEVDLGEAWLLGSTARLSVSLARPHLGVGFVQPGDLRGVHLSLMDDLVDGSLIDADTVARSGRDRDDVDYFLARLDPDRLTDREVLGLAHQGEAIRRAFLRGDRGGLDAFPPSPIRDHLVALLALKQGRTKDVDIDAVFEADRGRVKQLVQVAETVNAGGDPTELLDDDLVDDRTVWQVLVDIAGFDKFTVTDSLRTRFPLFCEWLSLLQAREHLFLGQWEQGSDACRQCLALAKDEAVRDEALNMLACSLYYQGNPFAAVSALDTALEGEYSVALLANVGVVAASLDNEVAAKHLARLVVESPSLPMRVNAAKRAIFMWKQDHKLWEGADGDEAELPAVLRAPLRVLINEPIELGDFRVLADVLAQHDADWLRAPTSLRPSPHANSLEARYYRASATRDGFESVVNVMATVSDWNSAPAWIVAERDTLIRQTREFLIDNIDDPDNAAGTIALDLVDKVKGLSKDDDLVLSLLGVATLTYHFSSNDIEIGDNLVRLLNRCRAEAHTVDENRKDLIDNLVELATRRMAINIWHARIREMDSAIDAYNDALQRLEYAQIGSPPWFQARNVVSEVIVVLERSRQELEGWVKLVEHDGVRSDIRSSIDLAWENEQKARRVLS